MIAPKAETVDAGSLQNRIPTKTSRSVLRHWALVIVLYIPVLVFYGTHYWPKASGSIPTGFVQPDMPYYMAHAREYADGGTDGFRYALPFSADHDNRPIHFQPQIALLALIWQATEADPGILFVAFGLIFGLLCIHYGLKILYDVIGRDHAYTPWMSVIFLWGGGLLSLQGIFYGYLVGGTWDAAWAHAFHFDPAEGWWFLNLGRNLLYPFEAYYHFLFFAIVLLLMNRRYVAASSIAFLLAISHPFTGVATLLMLLVWAAIERWYVRSPLMPASFPITILGIFILAFVHYGLILPSDPEHRVLMEQWTLNWVYRAVSFVPAYVLVAGMAFFRLRSPTRLSQFLRDPTQRLFVIWLLVWFALANHEFAFEPHQPLHFTRGYIWTPLFLIGAPFLIEAGSWLRSKFKWQGVALITAVFAMVILSDNITWLYYQYKENLNATSVSIFISPDQQEIYDQLDLPHDGRPLLVAQETSLAYMAMVYTPLRSYCSHPWNTPYAPQRRASLASYFEGHIDDPLLTRDLLVVVNEQDGPFVFAHRSTLLYTNDSYSLYRVPPITLDDPIQSSRNASQDVTLH